MILLGIAYANLARGIERRNLAWAELCIRPVCAVDLLAFSIALLLGRGYGLGLAAILFEWDGLLKAFAVLFYSNPRPVSAPGFNDTDVM